MTIVAGIVIAWPSTNASIPSGWAEQTEMASRYVQSSSAGANSDLVTDNGNTEHLHTMAAHTHSVNGSSYTAPRRANDLDLITIISSHTHAPYTSNSATATLDNTTNDYLRLNVIFIKSDGTPTGIPNGAIAMYRSDSLPGSWTRVNGNGFLKGTTAGGNGSATQTGANTHTHTSPVHSHAVKTSPGPTGSTVTVNTSLTTFLASESHTHDVTLTNLAITFSTDDIEPLYRAINFIKNDTGATAMPNKICAYWNGNHSTIPTDWARLTSWDGRFARAANANGESDVTTGGTSGTHTHTQTHANGYSDAGSSGNILADDAVLTSGGARASTDPHTHTWLIGNSFTASNASASSAHYPKFRTMILVEWTDPTPAVSLRLLSLTGVGI